MTTKTALLLVCIVLSKNLYPQNCGALLIAEKKEKDQPFCGSVITLDSYGFIYLNTGCEQHSSFAIDRFHISHDSILLDRFNFLLEKAFVYIKKKKSDRNIQKIVFLSLEGKKFNYRKDERKPLFFAIARNAKDKKRYLHADSSTLVFKNGSVKVIDIPMLNQIFGVPEPLWIQKGFDYEIMINAPHALLSSCLHQVSNFSSDFILVSQNELLSPSSGMSYPIICMRPDLFK